MTLGFYAMLVLKHNACGLNKKVCLDQKLSPPKCVNQHPNYFSVNVRKSFSDKLSLSQLLDPFHGKANLSDGKMLLQ